MNLRESVLRIIINAETRAAIAQLKGFETQVKETAATTEQASGQIASASTGLNTLSQSANTAKSAIAGLATGLAIGGVLLGIGLAIDAIHTYADELGAAAAQQKAYNTAINGGASSAQKEASEVEALGSIILDETNKRETRLAAFKQLQSEYPGYFGNLDLEKTSLQQIQVELDKVTSALVRQAQIKGLEGAIADVYKEQAELLSKNYLQASTTFDKIKALFSGLGTVQGTISSLISAQSDKANELGKSLDFLQKKLTDLVKVGIESNDQLLKFKPTKPVKVEAPEVALDPEKVTVGELQQNDLEDSLSSAAKHLKTIDFKVPIHFTPEIEASNKTFADLQKKITAIEHQLKQVLAGSIEGLAEGIGSALSGQGFNAAISSFAHVIGEGLKTVGRILIESAITMEAVEKAAKALATANPALGIVAGIAAIAAGTLIENLATSQIKATKFADGGVVTGPTIGLVGEAGPEAIIPLKKLNNMMGGIGGGDGYTHTIQFKGSDLLILLKRAQKNQKFVS